MRLLLVEDDAKLGRMLSRGLSEEGFTVEWARDGARGADELRGRPYDVCVLDVMLPELDGFDVLSRARAAHVKTPVLMLTARDAIRDRVRGLEAGADDYLVKPFAFAELLARLRALLRRQPAGDRSTLRWRDLAVDTAAHRVTRAGAAVEVSQKQFAVLEFLLRHTGQVVSRNMILEHVFGYRFDPGTNLVDVHVSHLRQRLDRPGEESIIQTIRGVGYRIGDE